MGAKALERLKVWEKARSLAIEIYKKVLPLLPPEEKWNLGQQLRRASVSVPANIAEGHGRFYYQDNVRFCYNARGSLEEVLSHLKIACDLGYIPDTLYGPLLLQGEELERMLNGYITFLKESKQGANEPGAQRSIREEEISYERESSLDPHGLEDFTD